MKTAFFKYNTFYEQSKVHSNSFWRRFPVQSANGFISIIERKKVNVHRIIKLLVENAIFIQIILNCVQ